MATAMPMVSFGTFSVVSPVNMKVPFRTHFENGSGVETTEVAATSVSAEVVGTTPTTFALTVRLGSLVTVTKVSSMNRPRSAEKASSMISGPPPPVAGPLVGKYQAVIVRGEVPTVWVSATGGRTCPLVPSVTLQNMRLAMPLPLMMVYGSWGKKGGMVTPPGGTSPPAIGARAKSTEVFRGCR